MHGFPFQRRQSDFFRAEPVRIVLPRQPKGAMKSAGADMAGIFLSGHMGILRQLVTAAALLEWKSLKARRQSCPLCGPSVIVQLSASALGVRCLRCAASAITMSVVSVLQQEIHALGDLHVYEL